MKSYKLDAKAMEQVQLKISAMKNDDNLDTPSNPGLEELPGSTVTALTKTVKQWWAVKKKAELEYSYIASLKLEKF